MFFKFCVFCLVLFFVFLIVIVIVFCLLVMILIILFGEMLKVGIYFVVFSMLSFLFVFVLI